MEFNFTAERVFDASHEEEFCPFGARLHGHRWKVSTSIHSRFDPLKGRLIPQSLGTDLLNLLTEVHGRHLNEMLPGTHTMPENIAAWVMERLSLQYRTLYKVKVWMDDLEYVSVRREVRA
jgi:6-pyruvoyl-tetrahydropterin synthase